MAAPKKYPDELRARAVRLYRESDPKPTIRRLAEQLNVHHEALVHEGGVAGRGFGQFAFEGAATKRREVLPELLGGLRRGGGCEQAEREGKEHQATIIVPCLPAERP